MAELFKDIRLDTHRGGNHRARHVLDSRSRWQGRPACTLGSDGCACRLHVRGGGDGVQHEGGLAFASPLGVRQLSHPLSAQQAAQFIRESREVAFFLAYLGGVTLAAGWQGIGVMRTRRDPKSFRTPFVLSLNVVVVLAALESLALGIFTPSAIFAAMSSVGFVVSGGNLFYLLRGPATRMDFWYQHISSMIGTGIAGYTAFLVFGGRHLLAPLVQPQYYILFWLLPTVIGSPAIALTIAYYKRKFSGGGRAAKAGGPQATLAV